MSGLLVSLLRGVESLRVKLGARMPSGKSVRPNLRSLDSTLVVTTLFPPTVPAATLLVGTHRTCPRLTYLATACHPSHVTGPGALWLCDRGRAAGHRASVRRCRRQCSDDHDGNGRCGAVGDSPSSASRSVTCGPKALTRPVLVINDWRACAVRESVTGSVMLCWRAQHRAWVTTTVPAQVTVTVDRSATTSTVRPTTAGFTE